MEPGTRSNRPWFSVQAALGGHGGGLLMHWLRVLTYTEESRRGRNHPCSYVTVF